MAYTSPLDIKRVVNNLPANFSEERLQYYADKASAYIDGALGGVFAIPFIDPAPKLIQYLANDLAVYFLLEDLYTGQKPNSVEDMPEKWDRIQKTLSDIVSGSVNIGIEIIVSRDPAGFSTTNETDNIFSIDRPYW